MMYEDVSCVSGTPSPDPGYHVLSLFSVSVNPPNYQTQEAEHLLTWTRYGEQGLVRTRVHLFLGHRVISPGTLHWTLDTLI